MRFLFSKPLNVRAGSKLALVHEHPNVAQTEAIGACEIIGLQCAALGQQLEGKSDRSLTG
jgi:hypothetical protein